MTYCLLFALHARLALAAILRAKLLAAARCVSARMASGLTSLNDDNDNNNLYKTAEEHWKAVPATVNGMLGGVTQIANQDVDASRRFLHKLLQKTKGSKNKALDCGAGIGRVTKFVLLPFFKSVDMVDVTQSFLDASVGFLGPQLNARVENRFPCGLQDFVFDERTYDVIWCQWVLGHLTDDDLIAFFERCKSALNASGAIILKENVASSKDRDYDDEDASYTRSHSVFQELFKRANLKIVKDQRQLGFPKGLYEVRMIALQPKPALENKEPSV